MAHPVPVSEPCQPIHWMVFRAEFEHRDLQRWSSFNDDSEGYQTSNLRLWGLVWDFQFSSHKIWDLRELQLEICEPTTELKIQNLDYKVLFRLLFWFLARVSVFYHRKSFQITRFVYTKATERRLQPLKRAREDFEKNSSLEMHHLECIIYAKQSRLPELRYDD